MGLINFDTIIWTLINFAILFFLLKKFLFKPVTEMMENRTKSIEDEINDARSKLEDAEKTKKEYESMLSAAYTKREEIIQAAKESASRESEDILRQARREADAVISRAQEAIELEKQKALKDIRNEITSLAFTAASKILQKNVDTEANNKIVQNFLDEEGVA